MRRLVLAGSLAALVTPASWATTHYVSNNATRTAGCTNYADPCRPNEVEDEVSPGDTVIFKDGVYTGANYMLDVTYDGTSGSRITIRAETPHEVLFNGEFARRPINLDGNYLDGSGFLACCSSGPVVDLGSNSTITDTIAWDAFPGNNPVFAGSGSNLVIDTCAGFGQGRKIFGATADNCNNRRVSYSIGRWMGATETGPKAAIDLVYEVADAGDADGCTGNVIESGIFVATTELQPSTYQQTYEDGDAGDDPEIACWCNPTTSGCTGVCSQTVNLNGCTNVGNWRAAANAGAMDTNQDLSLYGNLFILNEGTNCHGATDDGVFSIWSCSGSGNFSNITVTNNAAFAGSTHTSTSGCCLGASSVAGPSLSVTDLACVSPKGSTIDADWSQTDVQTVTALGSLADDVYQGANARVRYRYVDGVEQTGLYLFPHPLQDALTRLWTRRGDVGAHGSPWPGDPLHERAEFQNCSGSTCTLNYVAEAYTALNPIGEITSAFGRPPRGVAQRRVL